MKLVLSSVFLTFLLKFASSVVIQTQHGPVEGGVRTSDLGRDYFSFQGIPYAKAAEGSLMFRVSLKLPHNFFMISL